MEHEQARMRVAKLALDLHKLAAKTVPGGRPDTVLVLRALFVAKGPQSASQLARATGLSRQRCLRRLAELLYANLVAREANCKFSMVYKNMRRMYPLDKAVRLIVNTASDLSKLDNNFTSS